MKIAVFLSATLVLIATVRAQENALPKRPDVLFIICDDLNTSSLPCYGNTVVKTPNIDRLAARGEKFDHAYCQWPLCLPSRNSFISGHRPNAHFSSNASMRDVVPGVVFLPEYFRKSGYFTARVG